MKKNSFLIIVLLVSILSCKDDPEPSRADLLTANAWTIDEVFGGGKLQTIEGCRFDSRWEYMRDKTFKLDAGEEKCSADEPQVMNGTWKLVNNETGLEVQLLANLLKFEIMELKPRLLRLKNENGLLLKYEDANN